MTYICIPSSKITEFRKALKYKELNVPKLINMSTEERTTLFSKFAGNDAKAVNTLFEEKLILKNRIQGIKNWASRVGQLGRYDPQQKAKLDALMSEYVARQQQRIFNPQENEAFLADLVEEKFGTKISREEAANVFNLANKVEELKGNFNGKVWTSGTDRLNYGASKVIYEKYVAALKSGDTSVKSLANNIWQETKLTWKENKPKAILDLLYRGIRGISESSVSLVASLDNSFLGRQGLRTLQTHPSIWWNGAKNSWKDIAGALKGQGEQMKDAVLADIYSRPNYINGNYKTAKLIPRFEEQFPVSWPERVPGFGRMFKGSQIAFEGSAIRMRSDLFDLLSGIAEKNGVAMDKYQVQSIGKVVTSLTARGQWGARGTPPFVRLILWAPKMLKGNIDVLTMHVGQDISPFARRQAAVNLLKIVTETAVVMGIANAIHPGSATLDPRSSNFGKIRIGDTRIDITGGAASIITLAARLITNSSKSSTTGIVTKYGSGYAQTSRFDAIIEFFTGKSAPFARMIIDILQGKTYQGKQPTAGRELYALVTPISIQNLIDLKDNASADRILGVLADALGFSANSYGAMDVDWELNTGVKLTQFKQKVGQRKFKEANDLFNQEFNNWLNSVLADPNFQVLSDEDKQRVITNKRATLQKAILARYGFVYTPTPSKPVPPF